MSSQTTMSPLQKLFASRHGEVSQRHFDLPLLLVALALMSIGWVMVTSASMPTATNLKGDPFYFAIRHGIFLCVSLMAFLVCMEIPLRWWQVTNAWLLMLGVVLLVLVLLVGHTVNGSTRWLRLGPANLQAAEFAKLFLFSYLAGYLVRRYDEVQENLKGFMKPLAVFFVLAVLLLMQPDLGSVIVMFITTLGLLFLAGARLWQFFAIVFTGLFAVIALIFISEYRRQRITAFLDPWADPFGSGYQLTQSLMAYGRGDIFGQGLGNSLQKLEYLPEAHTDFIMAILAEELGFSGVLAVLGLLLFMVIRALNIGKRALQHDKPYEGYLAYAIGIWFCFQTVVNVGASAGILPTKGLTLPLVSYGGSSLLVSAIALAILMRVDFETRVDGLHAFGRSKKSARKSVKARKDAVYD